MTSDTQPETPDESGGAGRPPWEPTSEQRGEVRAFTIAGYTQDQIGAYLGVDAKTLRKHCRAELDQSLMKVIASASQNVVRAALGAPAQYDEDKNLVRAEVMPQAWALCFLLKTRGKKQGWVERNEHTGEDGKDLFANLDLSKLTDERFKQLKELLRDAGLAIQD